MMVTVTEIDILDYLDGLYKKEVEHIGMIRWSANEVRLYGYTTIRSANLPEGYRVVWAKHTW